MKYLICWLKAIPLWLRTGEFVPHLYESTYEPGIVIATENGFRISDNYTHTPAEVVYKDACIERYKCIYCGHEEIGWYRSFSEKEEMER